MNLIFSIRGFCPLDWLIEGAATLLTFVIYSIVTADTLLLGGGTDLIEWRDFPVTPQTIPRLHIPLCSCSTAGPQQHSCCVDSRVAPIRPLGRYVSNPFAAVRQLEAVAVKFPENRLHPNTIVSAGR